MSERATKSSFPTLAPPRRSEPLGYLRSFSMEEMERLRNGLIPEQMEDRWFVYYLDGWLYLHRSWSGALIYWLRLDEGPDGGEAAESFVSRDPVHYTETDLSYDRSVLDFVISALVLRQDVSFPVRKQHAEPSSKGTAVIAQEMFAGDQLYQKRARQALPILVRQALAQEPIEYNCLAKEIGMPNPRNLNFVLGSVGITLKHLEQKLGKVIPPIQSLVINRSSGLPGDGFFEGFTTLEAPTLQQREAALKKALGDVFAYPAWQMVLQDLKLLPAESVDAALVVEQAGTMVGGGEGEPHRLLKNLIFEYPALVGAPRSPQLRDREHPLPSGDRLDVFFKYQKCEYAIEVKPSVSPDEDIARGLFQCIKYEAVLRKLRAWENKQVEIQVVLALGGTLPPALTGLRNALGVFIVENLEATTKPI